MCTIHYSYIPARLSNSRFALCRYMPKQYVIARPRIMPPTRRLVVRVSSLSEETKVEENNQKRMKMGVISIPRGTAGVALNCLLYPRCVFKDFPPLHCLQDTVFVVTQAHLTAQIKPG